MGGQDSIQHPFGFVAGGLNQVSLDNDLLQQNTSRTLANNELANASSNIIIDYSLLFSQESQLDLEIDLLLGKIKEAHKNFNMKEL